MSASRNEALSAARKLLRTFGSAPEPRRQARAIYAELTHAAGWTEGERRAIDAFGAWLLAQPSTLELKPRCADLLATLR
ncbi:MAG: hypothetical protein GC203_13905 [Phenylobacterium sp.]|uniref:hypothetical protein n=1 Tax=Phenylobacterium sp. TaxID=1871053 RepID=UPI0025CD190D|nr:hypothetical protein [Phenylobacterium sp.]MBI1198951.1 hypothetical protein [Phenylobacterium sp.]